MLQVVIKIYCYIVKNKAFYKEKCCKYKVYITILSRFFVVSCLNKNHLLYFLSLSDHDQLFWFFKVSSGNISSFPYFMMVIEISLYNTVFIWISSQSFSNNWNICIDFFQVDQIINIVNIYISTYRLRCNLIIFWLFVVIVQVDWFIFFLKKKTNICFVVFWIN